MLDVALNLILICHLITSIIVFHDLVNHIILNLKLDLIHPLEITIHLALYGILIRLQPIDPQISSASLFVTFSTNQNQSLLVVPLPNLELSVPYLELILITKLFLKVA